MAQKWHTRGMNQDIAYWAPGVEDGFGRLVFSSNPVPVKGMWVDEVEEVRSATGEQQISNAQVFLPATPTFETGGFLYKGKVGSVQGQDPQDLVGARKIIKAGTIKSFRGHKTLQQVWL